MKKRYETFEQYWETQKKYTFKGKERTDQDYILQRMYAEKAWKACEENYKEPIRCGNCHGTNSFICGPECM